MSMKQPSETTPKLLLDKKEVAYFREQRKQCAPLVYRLVDGDSFGCIPFEKDSDGNFIPNGYDKYAVELIRNAL